MQIHLLQHEDYETAGHIADWASAKGHALTYLRASSGDLPARLSELRLLVILGGALNVDDVTEHSWLEKEKGFIRQAIKHGIPTLGICLGSQLLAEALGAAISDNPVQEIGWHTMTFDQARLDQTGLGDIPLPEKALAWHGQTFEIPPGATRLASSSYCHNQMFIASGHYIGVQFHPEWTKDIVKHVIDAEPATPNGRNIQSAPEILGGNFNQTRPFLFALLDHLASEA